MSGENLKSINRQSSLSVESLCLFGLALLLLVASRAGWVLTTGRDAANGISFSADEGFMFEYAIVSMGLALFSIALRARGTSLVRECNKLAIIFGGTEKPELKSDQADWFAIAWLVTLVGIAAGVGLKLIDQPMRYDEAFTYLTFIQPGGSYLFYYPLPNNHVFYTLAASTSAFFFGPNPVSLRWPSLVFGLGSVILSFRLGRKLSGDHGGYLVAAGVALCPILVSYSALARGYSLLILLLLAMLTIVTDDTRFPWQTKPVAIALLASAALFVMPSAAYMIAGVCMWAVAFRITRHRESWRDVVDFALPLAAMGLFFTAVLYLPVLLVNSLDLVVQNRFFVSVGMDELLRSAGPHFQDTWNEMTRDVSAVGKLSVAILLGVALWTSVRDGNRRLWLLLPSVFAGSAVVFFVKHSIPFPRTWMYLIPIVLLVADVGFAWLVGRIPSHLRKPALALLLIGCATFAIGLLRSQSLESTPDAGAAPDARAMSTHIDNITKPGDWLCARVPVDVPLRYYLSMEHPTGTTAFDATERVYYVVDGPFVGNAFVAAQTVQPVARAGRLMMYSLKPSLPIDKAGVSFHCWLRSGVFLA